MASRRTGRRRRRLLLFVDLAPGAMVPAPAHPLRPQGSRRRPRGGRAARGGGPDRPADPPLSSRAGRLPSGDRRTVAWCVMAEENETPGREPTGPAEGDGRAPHPRPDRGRPARRTPRAARRRERRGGAAHAARRPPRRPCRRSNATSSSLQQRLREAEEERGRLADLLEAERIVAVEREHELRRVKQREYAEQQLRVEAEERADRRRAREPRRARAARHAA